jgi:hypothetical protein
MTAREIAEKYCGARIFIKNGKKSPYGIVSGYTGDAVIYEPLTLGTGVDIIGFDKRSLVLLRDIKKCFTFYKGLFGKSIILDPIIEQKNDDCFDCGAIGDEPCKNNCPNK